MRIKVGLAVGTGALALAAALAAPSFAAPNTVNTMSNSMSSSELNVNIAEQNKSGQNGTAVIKNESGGVMVTVALKGSPSGASEPAHIHEGTCAKLNPAPWKPLTNVVNGSSVTHLTGVTVAQLKAAKYAINVHESAANLAHYVACGDL